MTNTTSKFQMFIRKETITTKITPKRSLLRQLLKMELARQFTNQRLFTLMVKFMKNTQSLMMMVLVTGRLMSSLIELTMILIISPIFELNYLFKVIKFLIF